MKPFLHFLKCVEHLTPRREDPLPPRDLDAEVRAELSALRAELGYAETMRRVEDAERVQETHRIVRQRNHLGPAMAAIYGRGR